MSTTKFIGENNHKKQSKSIKVLPETDFCINFVT